ncbi:MAG: PspC family transcriptional regulator, partial [Bacteroidota bacterium]
MYRLKYFVENQAFGVCTRLGEKFKISTSSIRLYFIYTSFLTLGSPIIIYLFLAFWMNIRRYLRQRN